MLARVSPGRDHVELDVDTRFQVFGDELETRDLADGTNGIVHLARLSRPSVQSQLIAGWDAPVTLAAGRMPDGRALTLEVLVRKCP